MNPEQWLAEFRALHAKARAGKLTGSEEQTYLTLREQFARSLVVAQGLTVEPGQDARRTFRVAQGMQVDLEFAAGSQRCMTVDISAGGFAVLMHRPPDEKEMPGFQLRMPEGRDPLIGRVKLVSTRKQMGSNRVSYVFQDMPEKERDRLEGVLFDLVLARLK